MKKLITITALFCAFSLPSAALAHGSMQSGYLEQALSTLPQEKAEDFRDAMQQAHEENKELYGQAHQLRQDMRRILTAPDFDADAFTAKSEELRQVHDQITENLDDAFAQAAEDLSPRERMKLADALERAHEEKKAMRKSSREQQ